MKRETSIARYDTQGQQTAWSHRMGNQAVAGFTSFYYDAAGNPTSQDDTLHYHLNRYYSCVLGRLLRFHMSKLQAEDLCHDVYDM